MANNKRKNRIQNSMAVEATVQTLDRPFIPSTSLNEDDNVSTYSRQETFRMARYMVTNYPLFEHILTKIENYGIGNGISVNASTIDQVFNNDASQYFNRWANNAFSFANNNYNFYQAQKIIERLRFIDGDVFVLLTKSESGWPQLQIITADQVRTDEEDGSIDGVYVDESGRKTAFNVYSGDVKQVVDAGNILQIMKYKRSPNQLRGLSEFTSCLNNARDHKLISSLAKLALKQHSAVAFVVTKNTGESGNGLFGQVKSYNNTPSAKSVCVPETQKSSGVERILPGATAYLKPGEKVETIKSDVGNTQFQSFLDRMAQETCHAIGLPFEFIVSPAGINSVGVRFIIQDADKYFSSIQNEQIDGFIRRVYGWVISIGINTGGIKPPTDTTINIYDCSFTKPQSITVDSTRISAADISLIDKGLMTYETYFSARGKNWIHELTQRAKEKALITQLEKDFGLPLGSLTTAPNPNAQPLTVEPELTEEEEENSSPEPTKD